ncbi:YopX family protein [Sporosarcina sp. FA9]
MYNSRWYEVPIVHKTIGQFTGLEDTNGKEIYEGDILHYLIEEYPGGHYREREEKRIVEFVDGCFWLLSKNGDEPLYAVHAADDELKILGNIYENPKLLEESK